MFNRQELIQKINGLELNTTLAETISLSLTNALEQNTPVECWIKIQALLPSKPNHFKIHHLIYTTLFPNYNYIPAIAWMPSNNEIKNSNLEKLRQSINLHNKTAYLNQDRMNEKDAELKNYLDLYQWSLDHYPLFWEKMTSMLNIIFDKPYRSIINLDQGYETPKWFEKGKMNIAKSCFNADPNLIAIISQKQDGTLINITYEELDKLSNQIANGLTQKFNIKDPIAIIMPMTINAVAIYLGIIKAGMVVVSIADSFAPDEIKSRLKISNTKAVFTQDIITRDEKILPMYEKIVESGANIAIIIPEHKRLIGEKRSQDILWSDFLSETTSYSAISCDPADHINILFSSGTTGDPKAIPWTHTTPIKSSTDANLHHNLKTGDIFCWYTNLGWMMGPWLIFATLINRASMALYPETPNGKGFGQFIEAAKVTHLGVVPTLVKTWRLSGCMEEFDWNSIKIFTSTGECSNPDDMLYLMYLANYRPVIEYCGGTEIGGAYITGTVIQPASPAAFTTPTLGLNFLILDENEKACDSGEVALIPPSIGLSTELVNKDHHEIYYQGMPVFNGRPLRRHGDEVSRYSNGFYRLHGRSDDTMNLSGIKVSSAEIERVLNTHPRIFETAAVAIEPMGGGPSGLVIYAVLKNVNHTKTHETPNNIDKKNLVSELQMLIKQHLNPLFKIYDLMLVDSLPRTASNKVMRRVLRNEYQKVINKKSIG